MPGWSKLVPGLIRSGSRSDTTEQASKFSPQRPNIAIYDSIIQRLGPDPAKWGNPMSPNLLAVRDEGISRPSTCLVCYEYCPGKPKAFAETAVPSE